LPDDPCQEANVPAEPIYWRETHDFNDPEFEPREVAAICEQGAWRISVKGIWDSCWSPFEAPPPELLATAVALAARRHLGGTAPR
jgi:hypothetical protein